MGQYFLLNKANWDNVLTTFLTEYEIYAPLLYNENQDYEVMTKELIPEIIYNTPKPATPLKTFFLPVEENVTDSNESFKKRIIIGIPNCDLTGLQLVDEIYLDEEYPDTIYKQRRDNTILIGTDCHSIQEHCHCTTYGINPYPDTNHDVLLTINEDLVYLKVNSEKGEKLVEKIPGDYLRKPTETQLQKILDARENIRAQLNDKNKDLPDYKETGELIRNSHNGIWKKYADTCVSCGACTAICPTCTCFLLIDKPGFEKIRHLDACQYPAFEKVAAGGDPLKNLSERFRNRYMCKYVWKPEKFESIACTGCGRCIETCIGDISKNELFIELKSE